MSRPKRNVLVPYKFKSSLQSGIMKLWVTIFCQKVWWRKYLCGSMAFFRSIRWVPHLLFWVINEISSLSFNKTYTLVIFLSLEVKIQFSLRYAKTFHIIQVRLAIRIKTFVSINTCIFWNCFVYTTRSYVYTKLQFSSQCLTPSHFFAFSQHLITPSSINSFTVTLP